MKKIKILPILLLAFILQGCFLSNPKYITISKKPSPDFYTKEIYKELLNDEEYTLELFDSNFYKNTTIEDIDNNDIIDNFISSLVNEDYREISEKPKDKEPYQLKVTFKDSKYVIKVYNENIVSISPWDGIYEEDIISLENLPPKYNLYNYCEHIKNQWIYNQ